ncbi:hypothetical protein [Sulfitobacter sp. SK011]|uniref:hypothetical protein n=1 Tax=Sulfitobacter sp. SK011 TaxID=1389004 RepID=UPI0013B3D68F|nr:hypothetical protein [Sulfitobacter sp. SK011]
MTSLILPRPAILRRLKDLWKALVPSNDCALPPDNPEEESRARRDMILEVLDRNPDAFQSEMDIQHLAHLYRCRL